MINLAILNSCSSEEKNGHHFQKEPKVASKFV